MRRVYKTCMEESIRIGKIPWRKQFGTGSHFRPSKKISNLNPSPIALKFE